MNKIPEPDGRLVIDEGRWPDCAGYCVATLIYEVNNAEKRAVAAKIAELLANVDMPEPAFSREIEYSGIAVNKVVTEQYYTADQMRDYAAAAVLRERKACAKLCEPLDCAHKCSVGHEFAEAIRNRSNV